MGKTQNNDATNENTNANTFGFTTLDAKTAAQLRTRTRGTKYNAIADAIKGAKETDVFSKEKCTKTEVHGMRAFVKGNETCKDWKVTCMKDGKDTWTVHIMHNGA